MSKEITSEFGKGFIYNLILFSKHWWRTFENIKAYKEVFKKETPEEEEQMAMDMWFNGASDHFYELEIPSQFKRKKIGKLAKWLQDRCLYLGHGFKEKGTKKDFEEVFEKLEELARLIDKELGIKDIKANFK